MRLILRTLALTAALMTAAAPALAADNMTVKDAAAANVTIRSKDVGGGVQAPTNTVARSDGTLIDPAIGFAGTATATITRPADTIQYTANDAWADSATVPTAGGFTLSGVCSATGRTSIIDSIDVISTVDPATTLLGEIWVFDSAATAVNDNAAFALSDADAIKLVGVVPFALATTQAGSGTNSYFSVNGLGMGATCNGSANLRFLVKVKNAYTPASGEQLVVRATFHGLN